jgi:integrase
MPLMRIDATGRSVTRTPATIENYRARYRSLCRSAEVDASDHRGVVNWFVCAHRRWVGATISQYRAAIVQGIEDASRELDMQASELLLACLKKGPLARVNGPPRTSTRKRKSIPPQEYGALIEWLMRRGSHPDDRLAARLLRHNVRLFLRPGEWETAIIEQGFLVVKNGKHTNGRATGTHRRLDLRDYGASGLRDLTNLLKAMKERTRISKSFRHVWGSLASRINRACEAIGIRRVAPYTTRHTGMAMAKRWMTAEEVAASAGHKTTATATKHYAKRRTGWRVRPAGFIRPSPEDIQKVNSSPKASREANLARGQKAHAIL